MFIQIKEKRLSSSPIQIFYIKEKGMNDKYYILAMRINGRIEYFYFEKKEEVESVFSYLKKLFEKDFIPIQNKMYKKSFIKAYEYLGMTPINKLAFLKLFTPAFPKGEAIFFSTEKELCDCLNLLDTELNVQKL